MNMFLLIPSIVFFFVYRALMRRSDRLTEGSRTAQTELGLCCRIAARWAGA